MLQPHTIVPPFWSFVVSSGPCLVLGFTCITPRRLLTSSPSEATCSCEVQRREFRVTSGGRWGRALVCGQLSLCRCCRCTVSLSPCARHFGSRPRSFSFHISCTSNFHPSLYTVQSCAFYRLFPVEQVATLLFSRGQFHPCLSIPPLRRESAPYVQ